MPMSCRNPLCARWTPPPVPDSRGLRSVRPATTHRPFGPFVGFERPPHPETPTRAKGLDVGRLTLEGLGGLAGATVAGVIAFPLIRVGAAAREDALVYLGLAVFELGWALGLHKVGQSLGVNGSFPLALGSTLLGNLVGGLLNVLAIQVADSPELFLSILCVSLVASLYVPPVVYEWGAGVYD